MEGIKVSGKHVAAWRRMAPLAGLLVGLLVAAGARADEGITVQGCGSAKARATQVEIECTIAADAELASDATVKFRDAKKRAVAAIEGMKNPDLAVTTDGMTISNALDANTQMMIMQRGGPGGPVKSRVQIVEKEHIVLSNTDKMAPDALLDALLKVLDVAKDAGYQVGPAAPTDYSDIQMSKMMGNSMVTYKLPDGTNLRDQAYKAAFEDAKVKAQKLADLAGVKLGRVLSIEEPSTKADLSGLPAYLIYQMTGTMGKSGANGEDKSLSSTTTGELTRHLNLTVQFEIVK